MCTILFKNPIPAVLKLDKELELADSYCPITLLSICCKVLDRMIYNRVSIFNNSILVEQVGFRPIVTGFFYGD